MRHSEEESQLINSRETLNFNLWNIVNISLYPNGRYSWLLGKLPGIYFGITEQDVLIRDLLGMGSGNERQSYNVMLSFIGWTHNQNDLMK